METKWKSIQWRVYLFYVLFLLAGTAIITKIIYIQSFKGEMAKINETLTTTTTTPVYSYRGSICASDGTPLAVSNPRYNVFMDFGTEMINEKENKKRDVLFWAKLDSVASGLSNITGQKTSDEFKQILTNGKNRNLRYVPLLKNVDYNQLKQIRELPFLKLGKYKGGLIIERVDVRERPFGNLALRTIGYFREDSVKVNNTQYKKNTRTVGLESWFNKQLTGKEGKQFYRTFSTTQFMPFDNMENVPPENGSDLITTLDIHLQDIAESALKKQLEALNAFQGTVVLMEVQTGDIKVMVNLQYWYGEYKEVYNYAINGGIEPGSTFKTASVLVALDDDLLKLTDSVYVGNGKKKYYEAEMKDSHPPKKPYMTLVEAFRESSNVGISSFIYNRYAGHQNDFVQGLYDLNLNKLTGIELPGENSPSIKSPKGKDWTAISLPWMSIGYELKIVPVQTLALYNAVANNGIWVKPHLMKEIRISGVPVEKFEPAVHQKTICSEKAAKNMQQLLLEVVENGTGTGIRSDQYKIAGKTGTAKIAEKTGGKYINNYNSSFVGYFPADNPRYSCIVIVNNPKSVFYGSVVAAPVFREIADYVYSTRLYTQSTTDSVYSKVPGILASGGFSSDYKTLFNNIKIPYQSPKSNSDWVSVVNTDMSVKVSPVYYPEGFMPDVMGMGAKDALFCLEKLGIGTLIQGKGYVVEQSIMPGEKINAQETVVLKLSTRM